MRILFDFRSYQLSYNRGIGRYMFSLATSLINNDMVDLSLLVSNELKGFELAQTLKSKVKVFELEKFNDYTLETNFDFFLKGNLFDEQYYTPNDIYPLDVIKKCNNVVAIIHDFIPLIFAGNYMKNDMARNIYAKQIVLSNYPIHFFANSQCTAEDGKKYLARPDEDFTVIYGGADEQEFYTPNSSKPYDAKNRSNNVVFVAGNNLRKNYHGATKAFARAFETGKLPPDAKLYLICSANDKFTKNVKNELKGYKAKFGKQVIVTDYISDKKMLDLLGNARASIFPSFYEGLGLPILESYIAGTPAFASNLSSTKEFVNEISSFDPYKEDEFVDTIIKIYNDEEFCRQSLSFGRQLVKKINWSNAAATMIAKLEKLAKSKNKKTGKTAVVAQDDTLLEKLRPFVQNGTEYDVFANFKSIKEYSDCLKNNENKGNVFPTEFFEYANCQQNYKEKISV